MALGFVPEIEGVNPLWVVGPLMVLRRATSFGIASPVSNMLYTVVDAESKYKAKHFIDTGVYRLGDFASGWTFRGLMLLGLGLGPIALIGASLGVVWAVVAGKLGTEFENRRDEQLQPRPSG
jgi:AAA family ATP:ADP antiporter